jgi:hypothetical protein
MKAGWEFKHLIGNENWLSSSMHMQVLPKVVLLDSSVNSDSSPAGRRIQVDEVKLGNVDRRI